MKEAEKFDAIGLDLGTTAVKGVRINAAGEVVASDGCPTHYDRPGTDMVEADPERHWRDVAALIGRLAAAPGAAPVKALACSGASGNTMLTDAAGAPLRPIINWMDRRSVGHPPPALAGLTVEEIRAVTGWPCLDTFPLAHLAWLLEHETATYRAAAHVCMNTDWLLYRMCGNWAMDYSTATTFHLQDQVGRCWHEPFLQRLQLVPSQLSRLCAPGTPVGTLTAEAAALTGLPRDATVVSGSFDHPSAARGVGVTEPGALMLSCGTSWVVFLPWAQRQEIVDAAMLCDPFLRDAGGAWGGMLSVPAIGPVIDDYVHHVIAPQAAAPLREFDALAATAPRGASGLRIDLRQPWQALPGASRANVARAVMEGAARLLAGRLDELRGRGFAFTRAVLVGGPGKSPIWPQIIAEETGLQLEVGSAHAGARGAALLAAAGRRQTIGI